MENVLSFLSFLTPIALSFLTLLTGILILLFKLILSAIISVSLNSKKLLRTVDNKWFGQIIGSIFVVALALAANNWVVYILSVVVIATLVTEMGFLLWVLTLLGNRVEVARTMVGAQVQEQSTVPENVNEVAKLVQALEETGKRLEEAESQAKFHLLTEYFYDTYARIFGSQIEMLRMIESLPGGKANRQMLEGFFANTQWIKSTPFSSYVGFLLVRQLLSYDALTDTYSLTDVGKTFLGFRVNKELDSITKLPF